MSLGTPTVQELHWLILVQEKTQIPSRALRDLSLTHLSGFFPTTSHNEPSVPIIWILVSCPNESTQFQNSASNMLLLPPEMVFVTTHLEDCDSFFKIMFRTSPLRPRDFLCSHDPFVGGPMVDGLVITYVVA